ncbi:hypothetical protein [Embleya sp. NPDC005971]|uniref:hypothetical protein n=1 Tax=Embleya sp. NPDC005971 TaxID=3156724 RepID=UPI0033F290AD
MAYAEERTVKNRRTGKTTTYWSGRWKKPDGTYPRVKGRFKTEALAIKAAETLEEQARANPKFVDPRKALTPLRDWGPKYLAARKTAEQTTITRTGRLRNILLPTWGDVAIGKITWWGVQTWAEDVEDRGIYDYDSIGDAITLLSMMLTAAVDADMLTINPIAGRRRPPRSRPRREKIWPTTEQALRAGDRCWREADRLTIQLATWCGMRWGEIGGLHRDNCLVEVVDHIGDREVTRYVIRIDPETGALKDYFPDKPDSLGVRRRKLFLGPPKGERGARSIDVPFFLVTELRAFLASTDRAYPFNGPRAKFRTKDGWRDVMRAVCDGVQAPGKRRSGRALRNGWEPVLLGLGLHGCRHAHKTWMEEGDHLGQMPDALQRERMGHSKAPGMKGVYDKVTPEMRWRLLAYLEERYWTSRFRVSGERPPAIENNPNPLPIFSQEAIRASRAPRRHEFKALRIRHTSGKRSPSPGLSAPTAHKDPQRGRLLAGASIGKPGHPSPATGLPQPDESSAYRNVR